MQEAFAKRRAAEREAEEKKRDARKAATEKKTLVQKAATEAQASAMAEVATLGSSALADNQKEGGMAHPNSPDDPMDHIPLIQRKRKVASSSELILLDDAKERVQGTSRKVQSAPSSSAQFPTESYHSSPQGVWGNLFLDGVSSAGVKLVNSLLSPAKESHLRSLSPNKKLFEGTSRTLSALGLQMLVADFEEVSSLAKKEANRARAVTELHQKMQGELERARLLHEEVVIGLRTVSEVNYQQLEEALGNLHRAQAEAAEAHARANTIRNLLSTFEAHV
ncbi:uncharacterized protein [Primulina huaijiensis]|uniref:uncharacterized protein n=1 Tax=Primulina huaijiensis TaxID=1492673 RepID=UPI003CC74BF3